MTPEQRFAKRCGAVGVSIPVNAFGGTVNFGRLTGESARWLIEHGYADENGNTNGSPTFGEITDFLEKNPSFVAHGYIVVADRSDERITLEGVIAEKDPSEEEVKNFVKMFRRADEFDLQRYRAWYD